MQNVNVSYINTYPAPDWPRLRRAAFNWSLLGFFLLDLVLLFCLLNPFATAQTSQHRVFTNQAQAAVLDESGSTGDKPSAFGPAVFHTAKVPAKAQASLR